METFSKLLEVSQLQTLIKFCKTISRRRVMTRQENADIFHLLDENTVD